MRKSKWSLENDNQVCDWPYRIGRGGEQPMNVECRFPVYFLWRCDPSRVMASSFLRFLDRTQRRTRVGRNPLDEWSARRRDFYLTTHNTHKRQTSMPPVGFEPTISAGERPQTYSLDRAATGTGSLQLMWKRNKGKIQFVFIKCRNLKTYSIYYLIIFLKLRKELNILCRLIERRFNCII